MQVWVIESKSGVSFEKAVDDAIKRIGEDNVYDVKYSRTDTLYSAMIIYK